MNIMCVVDFNAWMTREVGPGLQSKLQWRSRVGASQAQISWCSLVPARLSDYLSCKIWGPRRQPGKPFRPPGLAPGILLSGKVGGGRVGIPPSPHPPPGGGGVGVHNPPLLLIHQNMDNNTSNHKKIGHRMCGAKYRHIFLNDSKWPQIWKIFVCNTFWSPAKRFQANHRSIFTIGAKRRRKSYRFKMRDKKWSPWKRKRRGERGVLTPPPRPLLLPDLSKAENNPLAF